MAPSVRRGSLAAVGRGAGAGTEATLSGVADSARATGASGGSVVVKAGVSKNSTLTKSSELSSAWVRTLKAPGELVTTPTRKPRGSTPSLPDGQVDPVLRAHHAEVDDLRAGLRLAATHAVGNDSSSGLAETEFGLTGRLDSDGTRLYHSG